MKWKVVQMYFDSGKVKAYVEEAKPDDKPVFSESHTTHDLYIDLFDEYQAAVTFRNEALKA